MLIHLHFAYVQSKPLEKLILPKIINIIIYKNYNIQKWFSIINQLTIVYAATNLQPVFTSGYTTIGVQNVFNRVIICFSFLMITKKSKNLKTTNNNNKL